MAPHHSSIAAFPSAAAEFERYDSTKLPNGYRVWSGKHGHAWASYDGELDQSESDTREYSLIRLNNGMEVMVVSDEECDMAAASVCTRTGSVNDPEDIPGLSHLLEHMLFMGSEKYPGEAEWEEYLSQRGGESNGTTCHEYTEFYFNVPPDGMPGALDRLAAILRAPLFKANSLQREIKAVQAEFEEHKAADCSRFLSIRRLLAKKGHPFSKFTCGNDQTLGSNVMAAGIDLRERLIQHYEAHYSANLMRFTVVSNHSIHSMTEMVSGLFSEVPNYNIVPFKCLQGPASGPQLAQHLVFMQSNKEKDALNIRFELTEYDNDHVPFTCIIGDESKGSLLAHLKDKGWAQSLMAGPCGDDLTGYSNFDIGITLTPNGKLYYRDVIVACFSYILMLQARIKNKFDTTARDKFEEYLILAKLDFKFQEPGDAMDLASQLSNSLHETNSVKELLCQESGASVQWSHGAIMQALEQLNITNATIYLASHDPWLGVTLDKREATFEIDFATRPFGSLTQDCQHYIHQRDFSFPSKNPFVPQALSKLAPSALRNELVEPRILFEDKGGRVWHSEDFKFRVPKVFAYVSIRNPMASKNTRSELLARLFSDVVEENLKDISYPAGEAGLNLYFGHTDTGLEIQMDGWSENLLVLADYVFKAMADASVDDVTFARLKTNLEKSYRNLALHHRSGNRALQLFHAVCKPIHFDPEQRLTELKTVTAEEVLSFGAGVIRRCFVEFYLHGNHDERVALDMHRLWNSTLQSLAAAQTPQPVNFRLPSGFDKVITCVNNDDTQLQSSCVNVYQISLVEDRQKVVTLALLHSILQQPFFDELRTKRQLGYSVQLQQLTEGGFSYLALWVDGSHPPEVLNEAMENFISGCTSHIENLPEEVLEEHKRGLVNLFLETFKTMGEEASYLYTGIEDQRQGFDLYVKDAARVGSLTKKVGSPFTPELKHLGQRNRQSEVVSAAVQRAGAGDSEGLAELLEGGPTGAELLDMLGLPKDGGAVFDAVQALLYGPKLSGKLEVGDLPSLRANLTPRPQAKPFE